MHHEQELQNSCNTVFTRDMICFTYVSVNALHNGDYYYYYYYYGHCTHTSESANVKVQNM